jgi:outer membrane receptor protein involved in Fe transport
LNYELGTKGNALDHRVAFDASIYYIDWKDMQVGLADTDPQYYGFGYNSNAGRARISGAELSVEVRPVSDLKIGGWVAYNDAVMKENPPNSVIYAPPGSRLPLASHFSGNLSVDKSFPLGTGINGSVGAQLSYVGQHLGGFFGTPDVQRLNYPGYAELYLRAGLNINSWSVHLYANNVTDKRVFFLGGPEAFPPYAVYYIQPRTVGLSLIRSFY